MVFDSLKESNPDTDYLGMLHVRRGDVVDECDTSLIKMSNYLTCSLENLEVYGKVSLLFTSDERNVCYRNAIKEMIESLGFHFLDLDSYVMTTVSQYAKTLPSNTNPSRLENNMFVFKVEKEMEWHVNMTFRMSQRRSIECSSCDKLASSWQFEDKPVIAVPNEFKPVDFPQVSKSYSMCETEHGLEALPPTGSFANCTDRSFKEGAPHPDQKHVTIACETLPYRVPNRAVSEDIVVGVLSTAGKPGPSRRTAIRETWGKGHSVFFLISGPWTEEIAAEYEEQRDLIWLDTHESYLHVTEKVMLFMSVSNLFARDFGTKFAIKTDDDSYVDIPNLTQYLLNNRNSVQDYWGSCHLGQVQVYRKEKWKWALLRHEYPEDWFPPYCVGAGYMVSAHFLDLAVQHIANLRRMPWEDVATGILAERIGISPTDAENEKMVSNFRTYFEEEKKYVETGVKMKVDNLPLPDIKGKFIQHRIFDDLDMYQYHKLVKNPKENIAPRGCWRQCPARVMNKNIIILDHYGSAGLNDRAWLFEQVAQLAGYLCATVRVPPPRTMVSLLGRVWSLNFLISTLTSQTCNCISDSHSCPRNITAARSYPRKRSGLIL